jgi:hypothetical protein
MNIGLGGRGIPKVTLSLENLSVSQETRKGRRIAALVRISLREKSPDELVLA